MTHILELPDKYFKAAITTVFPKQLQAFRSMLETSGGGEVGWGKQSINKETENIKNGHFGTAKYNNQNKNLTGQAITKTETLLDRLIRKMEMTEKRISEFESRRI